MNEELQPTPSVQPILEPQIPVAPKPTKKKMPLWALVVLVLVLIVLFFASQMTTQVEVAPPVPTPFPTQQPSAIATDSAYVIWTQEVASLSGILTGFSLLDETIAIPNLEVDLDL